ncbi:hypothetical protein Tco_1039192, partial [Tanacetum coccineum]
EPIYDAWTRFKNLIQRVPHHGLDLWSIAQFFYHHVDQYTQIDLDFAADGNLRELSGEEAWETIENFAQGKKEWDNPPNIISEQEIENLKVHAKRLFGNENVWVQMHRGIAWDKVENPDPQSTPQVLPSFEEYTPPATYPKEVEETLGIPIEVEPLDETPLEDLGLNTCNHDIPLSSKEIPSIDEPEPQPQPLPNCLSLDVSLGEERGPEPPIKPHSPDSFRMKEVDSLTINTPPSPHVASSHPKDTYCYYRPCIDDPKKHYGFKPGLLGKSASLGVDISNWEMFDDDWGLESKEVSPLGKELSLFDRPNEVERGRILEAHRLEPILQQQISQRMAPSHHDGRKSHFLKDKKIPSVGVFDEAQAKRLFGKDDVWVQVHRGITWDKVENPDPQSTLQVLLSFEEYTPLATYPEEVEETLGIPIEVEPLDKTPLDDLGLNTCNHDIPLSSREIPREERGPEPPIKPHSLDSFRMKEVDSLTINTSPSLHAASSHPKDTYCYYRPCIDDPKKHYGFKSGLLGKSASLGVDISNWEMFDDDWGLESKEVSPLEKELSLFDRPNEVERGRILEAHRLEPILQQQISQHMALSHHDGMYHYYHQHLNSSVGEPSPLSIK